MSAPDFADIEASLRAAGVIPDGAPARFVPLTGGVASDIWRVEAGSAVFAVKRALAKLRVAADWRAPVDRNASEADWLRLAAKIVPGCAPRVIHHDPARGYFAMDYLPPERFPVWKSELRDGRIDPGFAGQVGSALAAIHAATAGDPGIAREFAFDAKFHAIRLEPYLEATARAHPALAANLMALSRDTLARHEALVHGDISPKNILAGPAGPIFLDAECAWYGDPAFDVAFCLNHLLLKCVWKPAQAARYLGAFDALRAAYFGGRSAGSQARVARLLPALTLARIDGKSPVEYIVDERDKARVRAVVSPLVATPPRDLDMVRDAWARAFAEGEGYG
ncbi:MAG: phosphotransferase [Tagaea sp.]|nr:phosphotransferase [Tagaea sp.]